MRDKIYDHICSVILWIVVFFTPTFSSLLCVGFFVICDMITGILVSHRRQNLKSLYQVIESRKLQRTLYKFIAYGIGVIVAFVMQYYFILEFPAMKLITGFIMYIELKSINENIEIVTKVNLFKTVIEKIKPQESPKNKS